MRIVDPDPILRVLETLLDAVQTDHDERVEGGDPIREAAWDSEEKTAKQGPNTTGKIVRKKRVNDRNARVLRNHSTASPDAPKPAPPGWR